MEEVRRYQSLLMELEDWLSRTQTSLAADIQLANADVVRDQIRASEVGLRGAASRGVAFRDVTCHTRVTTRTHM